MYLGNGRGRFRLAEGTPEYGGIYPSAPLAVGDVDGDGRPDLIGLRGGGVPSLRVLRNTGGRTPRHLRPQTISMSGPRSQEVTRGEGVTLSARLRCHPGDVALYRRPLRRPRGLWRRLATVATDYRGVAEVSDQPRVSSEYQFRATRRGKGRIKPTERVTVARAPATRKRGITRLGFRPDRAFVSGAVAGEGGPDICPRMVGRLEPDADTWSYPEERDSV